MKLVNSNAGLDAGMTVANPWHVVTNPWPSKSWPRPGPYCVTRSAAVILWFLQTVLGCRLFWKIARPFSKLRYAVDYFLHRDALMQKWTRNSDLHFLDASLMAYVNKGNGNVIFDYRTHGLSPINIARLIRAFEKLPLPAKENLNRVLRQERAQTQII